MQKFTYEENILLGQLLQSIPANCSEIERQITPSFKQDSSQNPPKEFQTPFNNTKFIGDNFVNKFDQQSQASAKEEQYSSQLNSNISDRGISIKERKLLMDQIKEMEDKLIRLQLELLQNEEQNYQEKDALRKQILRKEQDNFRQKKKVQQQQQYISKITNELNNGKLRIQELEQMVQQTIQDLTSQKMKCQELEQKLTKIQNFENSQKVKNLSEQKTEYENQIIEKSLQLKTVETENMKLRQQLDLRKSFFSISNSFNFDFEMGGTLECSQTNCKIESVIFNNFSDLNQNGIQVKDKQIEELLAEKVKNEKRIQELEGVLEGERFQSKQHIMQWENEVQNLIEKFKSMNLNSELAITNQTKQSDSKIEPMNLNNFSELYSKVLSEKVSKIEQQLEEIQTKELRIQELIITNENYSIQIKKWEDQAQILKKRIIKIDDELTQNQQENLKKTMQIQLLQKKNQELVADINQLADNKKIFQFFEKTPNKKDPN